jgi:hypothetical protein
MSSYLTTATASSTYQTIANMSSYLTTATASSTYQTIAGMSSYLTTASANSTFASLTGTNAFSGINTFNNTAGNGTTISKLAIGQITQATNTSNYLSNLQAGGNNVGNTQGVLSTSFNQVTTPNGLWLGNSLNNLSSTSVSVSNLLKSTPTSEQSVGWIVSTYTLLAQTTTYVYSQDLIQFTLPSSPNGSFSIWSISFNSEFDYFTPSNTTGNFKITLLGNDGGTDQVATQKITSYFVGTAGVSGSRKNFDFTAIIKCYDNKNPFKISISSQTTTTRFYPNPANVNYFSAIRLA